MYTLLGPAFSLAILTDRVAPAKPDVRQQYLSNVDSRSASEVNSAVSSLRLTANQLASTLHQILLNLLKKATASKMCVTWSWLTYYSACSPQRPAPNKTVLPLSRACSACTPTAMHSHQLPKAFNPCAVILFCKQDTRERMLAWLFAAVESNAERAKTMPDVRLAAPDGFFMNLAAVCIKLCQPFIQPSAKTWARIDAG